MAADELQPVSDGNIDSSLISDRAATSRFLDFIFHGVTGNFVEFRYFAPGIKPKIIDKSTYLSLPIDHTQLEEQVLSRNGEQMIMFGPAPRYKVISKGQAKDGDCLIATSIWSSLEYEKARGGAIEVLSLIQDFPLRPSIVVNSGYGRHIYFVFHFPFRDLDLLKWDLMFRTLQDVFQVNSPASISRVIQLPGTLNIRYSDAAPCLVCEEESSWLRYSIDEVKTAIEKASIRRATRNSKRTPQLGPSFWQSVLRTRGAPADLMDTILTGGRAGPDSANDGTADEYHRDVHVIESLLKINFSEEEIKSIFRSNPHGCGSRWAQGDDGESYLARALEKATAGLSHNRAGGDEEGDRLGGDRLPPNYSLKAYTKND